MDPVTAAALIGAGGQLISGKKASKATKQAAQTQAGMAAPFLQEATIGLPKMRGLIDQYLVPTVGKESPYLAAGHEENLAGIGRTMRRAEAGSERFWGATGNVGRGRGEKIRLEQGATEATSRENLRYGIGQEDYKSGQLTKTLGALSSLVGYGSQGLGPGMSAAQQYGQAKAGLWQDVAGAVGTGVGAYQGYQQNQQLMDLLKQIYGEGGGPPKTRRVRPPLSVLAEGH